MSDVRMVRPRWLTPLSLTLCVLGLAVSIYLTYEHFTGSKNLLCSESKTVNCLAVTTSEWSKFMGIPVSILGLLFFVGMTLLCLPKVWSSAPAIVDHIRLASVGIGVLMVGYLIWAELMWIHAICLWCTAVHVITFLLAIVVVVGQILSIPADLAAAARD